MVTFITQLKTGEGKGRLLRGTLCRKASGVEGMNVDVETQLGARAPCVHECVCLPAGAPVHVQ